MKSIRVLLVFVLFSAVSTLAQFKSQESRPNVAEGLMQESPSTVFLGWFNPEKFQMHHSLSLSYQTFDGHGLSLGTYTNSMLYDFADNVRARADISLSYSPYNSFSKFGKNDFSSIYLSRAQLDYKPWDNVTVQVQYRNSPYRYYSPFYSPWHTEDGF